MEQQVARRADRPSTDAAGPALLRRTGRSWRPELLALRTRLRRLAAAGPRRRPADAARRELAQAAERPGVTAVALSPPWRADASRLRWQRAGAGWKRLGRVSVLKIGTSRRGKLTRFGAAAAGWVDRGSP